MKTFNFPATAESGPDARRSSDSRWLTYNNRVNGVSNIWGQPPAGGPPKPLTHFTSDHVYNFAWSRDGRLALSCGGQGSDVVLITDFR